MSTENRTDRYAGNATFGVLPHRGCPERAGASVTADPTWTDGFLTHPAISREQRERIGAGIINAGFRRPERASLVISEHNAQHVTIAWDLPLALGALITTGQVRHYPAGLDMIGEVCIDGSVRHGALVARHPGLAELLGNIQPTDIASAVWIVDVAAGWSDGCGDWNMHGEPRWTRAHTPYLTGYCAGFRWTKTTELNYQRSREVAR